MTTFKFQRQFWANVLGIHTVEVEANTLDEALEMADGFDCKSEISREEIIETEDWEPVKD